MPITAINAEPIAGRVRADLAIASALATHAVGDYVLVQIHDDAGRVGLGEATVTAVWSGETQAGTVAVVRDVFTSHLRGADPFDVEWISRRMDRAAFGNSFAKAAVEMALYDLQGQILGVPVHKLLGGRENPHPGIRLKFVLGSVEPDQAARRARQLVGRGWRALKVKVGRDPHPRGDVARLRAVREAVGPDVWISVDANGGWNVEQALWAARRLSELDIALLEQPTRRGDHVSMAEVRRRSPIPVMADESVFTPQDALDVIRHEAADVLSLYPGKHGGLKVTQQIARLAEAAGIACTMGSNLEREVATAAMAHVTAATPNLQCDRYPGDLIGPLYFEHPLTAEALTYRVDRLIVPDRPGLGVRLKEVKETKQVQGAAG
jgi:muconate cycloisomerase